MPTYRIKYADGTRDTQEALHKGALKLARAPGGRGETLKVRSIKRIS